MTKRHHGRYRAEKQRIENYEKFLKEHKTRKRTATWCEFPHSQNSILSNKNTSKPAKKKKNQITDTSKSHDIQKKLDEQKGLIEQLKKNKPKVNVPAIDPQVHYTNNVKEKHTTNTLVTNTLEEQELGHPVNKNKNKKQKVCDKTNQSTKTNQNNKVNGAKAQQTQTPKQKKKKMLINGEPARRKPVNDNSFQLIINGKEVELVRFDGFPIMKKDAERLQDLKSSMIKKGIPKSEVQRTLKLERRRAEKALARLKRDVCYNCRKGGHNLSDCPELKTKIPGVGAPDGLCFKCGSTEHRQFECKVQKDKEFKFATCFICKEPGHIARQCPDNPKGLYPNGGSCKLCGDVTHLRKDCPTVQDKREDSSIKLQTFDNGELEGIQQKLATTSDETVKKPKKIMF